MDKICLVTSNVHKYHEISQLAEEFGIKLDLCADFKLEFQSDSLEEIVIKSAMLAHIYLNKPLIVEDAGLFIEALNGFPGPYSSYVYKTIGIQGILKLIESVENRRACFKSTAVFIESARNIIATGEVCGVISDKPRGVGGFGFDPIFIPDGENRTFAEMSVNEKNKYSHRAKALRKIFQSLTEGKADKNSTNIFINQK